MNNGGGPIKIRKLNPMLYWSLMAVSVGSVALAINFFTSTPTFNPLGIPKNIIGAIFLMLGVTQIVALNVAHNLRMIRLGQGAWAWFGLIWGLLNTEQSFAGDASFQLPILVTMIATLQVVWLLLGAAVSSMTRRE